MSCSRTQHSEPHPYTGYCTLKDLLDVFVKVLVSNGIVGMFESTILYRNNCPAVVWSL